MSEETIEHGRILLTLGLEAGLAGCGLWALPCPPEREATEGVPGGEVLAQGPLPPATRHHVQPATRHHLRIHAGDEQEAV